MFDEKRSKMRMRSDLHEIVEDLEEDIEILATKELWKELEELEEMMSMAS